MSGLVGFFQRSLDDKNRLVLPPELRRRLDSQVIMSRWYDNSLALFGEEEYGQLAESLHRQGAHSGQLRSARREIFGSASVVAIDGQGRMTVPDRLLDGFLMDPVKDRDLVLLGDWSRVLIFSGLRYGDLARKDLANLDDTLASVEKYSRGFDSVGPVEEEKGTN